MNSPNTLSIGQIVWARMKPWRAWPAKIAKPPKDEKVPASKKTQHWVFFFGTKDYGWVPEDCIWPFGEFKEKYQSPKGKSFCEALAAAEKCLAQTNKVKRAHPETDDPDEKIPAKKANIMNLSSKNCDVKDEPDNSTVSVNKHEFVAPLPVPPKKIKKISEANVLPSTSNAKNVSVSTNGPKGVSVSTNGPKGVSVSTNGPKGVSVSTNGPKGVSVSTNGLKGVSVSTNGPKGVSVSTNGPKGVSVSTNGPKGVSVSTNGPRGVSVSTNGPRGVSVSTNGPRGVSVSTNGPKGVSVSTNGPKGVSVSTNGPKGVSVSTNGPKKIFISANGRSPALISNNGPRRVEATTVSRSLIALPAFSGGVPRSSTTTNGPRGRPVSNNGPTTSLQPSVLLSPLPVSIAKFQVTDSLKIRAIPYNNEEKKPVETPKHKIGLLGLGILGKEILRNLLRSGHDVTIWNRTQSKYDEFLELGAKRGISPAQVFNSCDITLCCVSTPEAAKELVFMACGIYQHIKEGKGFVVFTSMDPESSLDICEAITRKGGFYLETPVCRSVTPGDGNMIILAAGDEHLFYMCGTIFASISLQTFYLGGAGNGSKISLILNSVLGTVIAALAEGMALAKRNGVCQTELLKILQLSSLNAPIIVEKGKAMIQRQRPVQMSLQHLQKDMNFALNLADSYNHSMPVAAAANEVYVYAKQLNCAEHDVSAVYLPARY